jgi:PTS system cellobiose-specific IIB component
MSIKIDLFCAGGMSTSLLMMNMRKAAEQQGIDIQVEAHGVGSVARYGVDSDVILIGPQVSYTEKEVHKQFPTKPVAVIPMRDYGMMDGHKVLQLALDLMKNQEV